MNRKERQLFLGGLLITLIVALILAQTTLGVYINRLIHDQATDHAIRNEVVIVGIDDTSLHTLGAWPWKRDIFATTIQKLQDAGVRAIVFDVLFLEPRDGDDSMDKVLQTAKVPVIFASKLDKEGEYLHPVYKETTTTLAGIAHVYPDNDGKVRTVPLFQKDTHGTCHISLAYQAFLAFTKQDKAPCNEDTISFLYQVQHPATISLTDVLDSKVNKESLEGTVVFIGSNTLDIEDHFVSLQGEKIPGVYVHASIFTTLLNKSWLTKVPYSIVIIITLISISSALFIIFRIKRSVTQGVFLLLGILFILSLGILFLQFSKSLSVADIIFPYILTALYAIQFRYITTDKKNAFIKELFGHYVNPKVLANILQTNNLKLGGEKKYISILFSDIRGFTTMTETMSAEKLVETLNSYLATMSPIIMDKDGVIDKYIGDAIMAFWNAPVDVANHEQKAVEASLYMIDALLATKKDHNLEIGIGLHAGEAIVGNIGSKDRVNYTIIGDAVNACSRLEGLTKKYGVRILISEQIKNALRSDAIIVRPIDIVRVKGKSEVMKIYEPLWKNDETVRRVTLSREAFEHYQKGDFDTSSSLYLELGDSYSFMMRERISQIRVKNIPHWTGVFDWDEK